MRGWTQNAVDRIHSKQRGFEVPVLPVVKIPKGKKIISFAGLMNKAQREFNAFIRARDMQRGCISCKTGKVQQASHFYNVGQFSGLRFNTDNVMGSCTRCNHYLHGNLLHYRQALIKRIGIQRVENLEITAMLIPRKDWSRFELELIYEKYKEKNSEQDLKEIVK